MSDLLGTPEGLSRVSGGDPNGVIGLFVEVESFPRKRG